MPSDTYHINASGNSFVHVGGNYQSGDTQRSKLLNYLLPNWQSNQSLGLYWDHNQARRKHVGETGEWIREDDGFRSWLFEQNSVLWLHGIAGCGKTVLSSTVIDYLQKSLPRESNYTALYYFNAREDEKRNVARLIRSLLLQLLPTEGKLSPQVEKLCNDPLHNSSDDQLLLALGELADREGDTYIVIDALDECDASFRSGEDSEVDKLDTFLLWLLQKPRNLHLLVTSRDGGLASPLQERLRSMTEKRPSSGLPYYAIDLESHKMKAKIKHDISELVASELKRWNALKGWRSWLPLDKDSQNLVTGAIEGRANGMFRLAACHLDLLRKKDSWDEVKLALNHLPSELFEVYDQIFQDIDDQGQLGTATILLRWLLYSNRPLSLGELTEVTMVDARGDSFSIGRRAKDESYVYVTLSSFVTISQDHLVQFSHQTVQEYLVSNKVQHGLFSRKAECLAWITRCCLTYMQFCAHRPESEEDGARPFGKRLPLLEYVSNNWYRHALGACTNPGKGEDPDEQISSSSSAAACLRDCSLPIANEDPDCQDARGLLFQWAAAVKLWLNQIVCTQDAPHSSALREVACRGYEKCIKAFFTDLTPSDPARESHGEVILKAAVIGRYEEMIQIALEGAREGQWNETPWWTAEGDALAESQVLKHESHRAIVQVLLDHGVNIDSSSPEDGWTALHIAAFQGDEKMMELLLSNDADTSVKDCNGRTALHVASSRGHDAIVQLCLKEGLSLEAKDNIGWTALDRAVHRAAIELTVQRLYAAIAAQGNSTHLESIHTSLDAEYSGIPVIPQVLQSNNKTIARTISLLLEARTDDQAEDTDTPRLVSGEPTEPAGSACRIQCETIDEESLMNVVAASTADNGHSFRGNMNQIIMGGHIKIGVSLMEDLLRGGPLVTSLFAPPFNSLQLCRRPTHSTTTRVKDVEIHGGTADFIRSHIRHLILYEVVANLTMSHIDELEFYGGAANFTMSHVSRLTLYAGTAVFSTARPVRDVAINQRTDVFQGSFHPAPSHTGNVPSSTVRLGHQEMFGGSDIFLPAGQLNQFLRHTGSAGFSSTVELGVGVIYGGSAIFSSTAKLNELVVYGGSAIFSSTAKVDELVVYGGSVTFCMESHINNVIVYGGYVNFLSTTELSALVIYRGCATFSAGPHITDTTVYGGQINFLSAADIDRATEYGGSLHFIHGIHRQILRILLGGVVDVEETDAETGTTTTTTARIRYLTTYGGFFNLCSRGELGDFTNCGGVLNFNHDRVMCLLAGCGQDALARLLLDEGANPSEIWPEPRWLLLAGGGEMVTSGWTALHEAAFRGQEAFVQMLLEKKADLGIRDGNGLTALQIAASQGHKAIVRLLEDKTIPADEGNRALGGEQEGLRKYAQGIYSAFRSLVG